MKLATANLTRSLPAANETASQIAGTLTSKVIYNLPPDYYANYIDRMQALTPDAVSTAARQMLAPAVMTWVVVGDMAEVGPSIKALDWGQIEPMDIHDATDDDASD